MNQQQPPEELRRSLDEALAAGPFSVALRLAIQVGGLSLDRLQHRLREQGISVSRTALSYWQSGRTQPERAESIRALRALEQVLDVPAGSLVGLLGPPRPRGRWTGHHVPRPTRPDRSWARPEGLLRVLAQVEAAPETMAHLLQRRRSTLVRLDAHRQIRSVFMQVVLEAQRPHVHRALMVHHFHMAGVPGPAIEQPRGWRPGRVRSDPETGFEVHEMILDRILPQGATAVTEYTLAFPPGHLDPHTAHRVVPGTRELTIEVVFDPAALPPLCRGFYQPSIAHPRTATEELLTGGTGTAAYTLFDPEPGIHGVAWEWN
ncbi:MULTISPECIES: hypothetical protein [Streptosporangium]|uniref:Transcriptional regulator with XRE-family HTH domain n=1 Tax=Streptosporangium brasiliense TaxID=47480 RepID=A0ABT9RJN5_9ACTN|nr:hypothetical protein [Streptosporangium brasiliense]MDP9869508.1 transcriptional regulator with XRE-family HTH domain [Streptosporangium brasiliense]